MHAARRSVEIAGHHRHELTWVVHGSAVVESVHDRWRLTTAHALWIPAGVDHRIELDGESLVFPLWFEPALHASPWREPRVIQRSPSLTAFARRMLQPGLSSPAELEEAVNGVYRLMQTHAEARELLPVPTDPRAREVAEGLLADPACPLTLEGWARRVHTSSKTLQRHFANETNLTFPAWRSAARLRASLPLLERGDQVAAVSAVVGFASASGFVTAFRKRYGCTPADHRRLARSSRVSAA
ncbi:MAG: AraC family transcriptional regulator [Microbacterium sp.]|jgi:AraC-like DNA-binding protein|nr:AraC family transcriptional regulator [Microbacterium sp.]